MFEIQAISLHFSHCVFVRLFKHQKHDLAHIDSKKSSQRNPTSQKPRQIQPGRGNPQRVDLNATERALYEKNLPSTANIRRWLP